MKQWWRPLTRSRSWSKRRSWRQLSSAATANNSSVSQESDDDDCYSFRHLAAAYDAIERAGNQQKERIRLLACALRPLLSNPKELAAALFLTASELAPPFKGIELRFGAKTFASMLPSTSSSNNQSDYGLHVKQLMQSDQLPWHQTPQRRTISQVHQALRKIAAIEGNGAVARKQELALELIQTCETMAEMVTIVRFLAHQNLRLGLGSKSMLSALAQACCLDDDDDAIKKQWIGSLKVAFARQPDYEALAQTVSRVRHQYDPLVALQAYAKPTIGVPVLTMAAYPVASVDEVLKRLQLSVATCEFKYDGARVQVHYDAQNPMNSKIFSRNMEDQTAKYGQLIQLIATQVGQSCILEGEVVAVERLDDGEMKLLPFQVLQNKQTINMCLFVFDLLLWNGQSLLSQPFHDRRALLRSYLKPKPGFVELVASLDLGDQLDSDERIRVFLQDAVRSQCEGLMIKTLESEYCAGERSYHWMKVKQDYLNAPKDQDHGTFLPDSLDLVVIGAYYGRGRRAGGFGSFLLAAFNAENQTFETIGKVGSGFTDVSLAQVTEELTPVILSSAPSEYITNLPPSRSPDVWFSPSKVWEIKATQLTRSPLYTCGLNDKKRGMALRFPRFVRVRPDKSIDQATQSAYITQLYHDQQDTKILS